MKKNIILSLLAFALTILLAFPAYNAAGKSKPVSVDFSKKFKWTCQSGWQPATPHHKQVVNWAKRVERQSGGRLKIKVHPAGAVVAPFEIYDAVRTGAIQAGHQWAGFWMAQDMTICLLANSPSFFDIDGYLAWLMAGGGFDFWKDVRNGEVISIFAGILPHETGMWSNRELNTLKDFKGLKYRGPIHNNDMLKTLGVAPVFLPPGEIISALRTGVVDAAEFSTPATDYSIGFHEVAKYYYFPGIHQYVQVQDLIINPKAWAELPDDLKAIVVGAAHQQIAVDHSEWWMADLYAMDKIRKYGTKIRKFTPEIQNYQVNTYIANYEKYADKNPLFAKVWEHQKNFLRRYYPYVELQTVEWADKNKFIKSLMK